jgi:predicted nucleic acid-binding protein
VAELVTLDSSVLVKLFIHEDGSDAAARLVADRVEANDPIVAPSWAWAEVGSTLARRLRALAESDADALWHGFLDLPIVYVDDHAIRDRAWEIARAFDMPTLYDAAFMAVTELAAGPAARTFWTADGELVRRLGPRRPSYVRELSELDRPA